MKGSFRTFRLEIVWVLILTALLLAVPGRLYGGADDDFWCYATDVGDCPGDCGGCN